MQDRLTHLRIEDILREIEHRKEKTYRETRAELDRKAEYDTSPQHLFMFQLWFFPWIIISIIFWIWSFFYPPRWLFSIAGWIYHIFYPASRFEFFWFQYFHWGYLIFLFLGIGIGCLFFCTRLWRYIYLPIKREICYPKKKLIPPIVVKEPEAPIPTEIKLSQNQEAEQFDIFLERMVQEMPEIPSPKKLPWWKRLFKRKQQ